MSQTLSEITNAGRTDLVPGYTLRRLSLAAIGQVEDALQRFHVERAAAATYRMDEAGQRQVVATVAADLAAAMVYATPMFVRVARSAQGTGAVLLASAAMTDPRVDAADLAAKVSALTPDAARAAADWCMGWDAPPLGKPDGADPLVSTPPNGGGGTGGGPTAG